jgi:hypothetical protein
MAATSAETRTRCFVSSMLSRDLKLNITHFSSLCNVFQLASPYCSLTGAMRALPTTVSDGYGITWYIVKTGEPPFRFFTVAYQVRQECCSSQDNPRKHKPMSTVKFLSKSGRKNVPVVSAAQFYLAGPNFFLELLLFAQSY